MLNQYNSGTRMVSMLEWVLELRACPGALRITASTWSRYADRRQHSVELRRRETQHVVLSNNNNNICM